MEITLGAVLRAKTGKEQATKLRQSGRVPGVIYGEAKPNVTISISNTELERALLNAGAGQLIKLVVADGDRSVSEMVILKDFQRHPVKGNIIHVDLLRVLMDHLISVKAPVYLEKEDERPRDGAFVKLLLHELEINCLPGNIPENLKVDVGKLALGSSLYVKDLTPPTGVRILNSPDEMVVTAIAPAGGVEAVTETAAATTTTGADAKK